HFRNSACRPACRTKSGVLRGHRVLVAVCPDVLAEETSAPSPGGETRSDFAPRNVAASRSLLQRLVFSLTAQTFLAGHIRVASGGMGNGTADRLHRSRFGVAGERRRAPFGEAMGFGRSPGGGPHAHSGRALSRCEEPDLRGHVWNVAGYRTGPDAMAPAAGCDCVVYCRNLHSHSQ